MNSTLTSTSTSTTTFTSENISDTLVKTLYEDDLTIIVIGDIHFQVINVVESEEFITKIISYVESINPDLIVVLGDILHTHEKVYSIAMNKAIEFLNSLRWISETFVLCGNHDYINNSQFLTENHWMNSLKHWEEITIVDNLVQYIKKGRKLLFVPYVSNGRFQEALDSNPMIDWRSVHCIFAHQEFKGCKMGGIISEFGDTWDIEFPFVISGHIHDNQRLQENIYYPGSSLETNYGDNKNNVIVKVTFTSENIYRPNIEEIELELARKTLIYLNMDDIDSFEVPEKKIKGEDNSQDKVKLSLSGSLEMFKVFKKTEKYAKLIENGIKVIFKPTKSDIQLKNSKIQDALKDIGENKSFNEILHTMVYVEKDPLLLEAYEYIVNQTVINSDDIMLL